MVFETIRIGTRRSQLSLWQANHIADLIRARNGDIQVELKTYQTRGDQNRETALPAIGGKGVFTEALENALRRNEIDFAVHSLKDLPVENADGLTIGALPKRGDHRDVLIGRGGFTLDQLPQGACVGTGSLRRQAQLLALRPDLQLMNIRGNVPTRIEKLLQADGPYDAIVLATAGLNRLGMTEHISEIFDMRQMISAAGQGALAVQCRYEGDSIAFLAKLNHVQTAHATEAERTFLHALEGGCSLPIGAYAHVKEDTLYLRGRVTSSDGSQQIDVTGETLAFDGPKGKFMARKLGTRLAQDALENGAREILSSIERGTLSAGEE